MSAMGHLLPNCEERGMSALSPIAAIGADMVSGRKMPEPDIGNTFGHVIDERHQILLEYPTRDPIRLCIVRC